MSCSTYRWTAERRGDVEGALRTSTTRAEAAQALGVSVASLGHACKTFGLRPLDMLQLPTSAPHKAAARLEDEDPGAAPWQGYRPKHNLPKPGPVPKASSTKVNPTLTVVLADAHVPHHDSKAYGCALGIIKELKPDRVVINGDFLDLESLSRHPKSQPDLAKLAEELYAGNLALDALQTAAGSADVVYLEGNHEGRARRFEAEFGQLDGVLSIPVGLYIEARSEYRKSADSLRGIRWIPLHMQPLAVGAVSYMHGVFESIHHAYQHAWQLGPRCSTRHLITAHMHALQVASTASGHTATACPWLGDIRSHVFGYTKGRPRPWSHGVLVIEEAGESVTVSPVAIINGRAVYGGRVVQSA